MVEEGPLVPDESDIERQAAAAGLGRAWADFRDDVLAAARQVAAQRSGSKSLEPAAEPWPPMTVPRTVAGR